MNDHHLASSTPPLAANRSPSATAVTEAAAARHHFGRVRASHPLLLAIFGLPLLIMLAIASFAWPAARLAPRDLPLGLVGPAGATEALRAPLEERGFAVSSYSDEAAARDAITDRDLYGALVVAPDGVRLLTASAASPLVAQLLQQVASAQIASNPTQPAPPLSVTDVVPADPDDPRGAVLGASVMPLVLAGMLLGAVMVVVSAPGARQIAALFAASALIGIAATLVVQTWLGAIGGSWWLNAGVLSLVVLAIALAVAGGVALVGPPGAAFAGLLMLFIGNPWSGVTSAPELMPAWIGITGQLLPPGAGGSLLRSIVYFDGAGGWRPLLVLVAWISLGLTLVGWMALWRRPVPPGRSPELAS